MLAGLVIYLCRPALLPLARRRRASSSRRSASSARQRGRDTFMLLLGVGLAVTVFRGAYEQVGNTVALWIDSGVDRARRRLRDPDDLVPVAEPAAGHRHDPAAARPLAAQGRRGPRAFAAPEDGDRRADRRRRLPAARRCVGAQRRPARAGCGLLAYFFVLTLGELYILPTGLGLFARLAPPKLGATTVAAWYLAIFAAA